MRENFDDEIQDLAKQLKHLILGIMLNKIAQVNIYHEMKLTKERFHFH